MPPFHLRLDEFPLKLKDEVSNCPLCLLESHGFAQVLGKWLKTWEHISHLHEKKDLVIWRSIYVYPQLAILTLFFLSSKTFLGNKYTLCLCCLICVGTSYWLILQWKH